jgi:hypothetical protein
VEQICDDFPKGAFDDCYLPVRRILDLSVEALEEVMSEKHRVWAGAGDIPEFLREYKSKYANVAVDPDTPPPRERVKAIRFLRQMRLPGSLLGEWQFPLPSLEVG